VSPHPLARLALSALLVAAAAGCGPTGPEATGRASATPTGRTTAITVAAAADLRPAFEELGRIFEDRTGTAVTFSFGSSGQLATQIVNGAPFDVFASANVAFVDEVVEAGKADASTRATYAFGRIVVYTPAPGGPTTLDALTAAAVEHVAIANPEHAPYGVAAEQALRRAGVYEQVRPKLVLGENVADTLRLATTGNADAAIVALSLVMTGSGGSWALVDQSLHDPLEQALVVTGVDPSRVDAARAFAAFVNAPEGREVMARYGFVLPEEVPR
jgi:molybdate transport system substrate-binding protein